LDLTDNYSIAGDRTRLCSMPDCDQVPRERQRYCANCHRKYMRAWRAKRKKAEADLKEELIRMRKRIVDLSRENEELKV
jgi:hypothetical protein